MTKNYIALSSLSMDLKRVALGYYSGAENTAQRFTKEALKRISEVDKKNIKPYLVKHLNNLPKVLKEENKEKLAEDALMYSTIFQNYSVHNK